MFIPLHDANALRHIRLQYVTIGLIVANVLVHLLTVAGTPQQVSAAQLEFGFTPALFTDFTYDNVGIPKNYASGYLTNPHNPDGPAFIDRGLGAVVHDPALDGAFKVPTLRNLALTAPYGHNGYFDTMEQIVTFYATRDTRPACANPKASAREAMAARCWPPAEVPGTVNRDEMGNLPLNQRDIADLVAFLNTLTDGYDPATGEAGTAPSSQAAR